jgi:hypothetical protein
MFLILFSIFQILMLTSIFGNVKVVSNIVVQENNNKSGSHFRSDSSEKENLAVL